MSLFEKCGHIPTIRVTVEEQEAKEPLPQGPSISGAMSQQLWIQCFLGHGGAWVGGDAPPTTPLPHTRCEKKSLETRDLDISVAIEFASISHRARRWVSAATQDLAYGL